MENPDSSLRKDGKWILEIHDNGIGFSEEYLEQFTERVKAFSMSQMKNNLEDSTVEGMGHLEYLYAYGDMLLKMILYFGC